MSLQSSSAAGRRLNGRVHRLSTTGTVRQDTCVNEASRTEYLSVFRDFSGRLYQLAVSVQADVSSQIRDAKS